MSSGPGCSVSWFFCVNAPMILCSASASSARRSRLGSRRMSGTIMSGNTTASLMGRIASSPGMLDVCTPGSSNSTLLFDFTRCSLGSRDLRAWARRIPAALLHVDAAPLRRIALLLQADFEQSVRVPVGEAGGLDGNRNADQTLERSDLDLQRVKLLASLGGQVLAHPADAQNGAVGEHGDVLLVHARDVHDHDEFRVRLAHVHGRPPIEGGLHLDLVLGRSVLGHEHLEQLANVVEFAQLVLEGKFRAGSREHDNQLLARGSVRVRKPRIYGHTTVNSTRRPANLSRKAPAGSG